MLGRTGSLGAFGPGQDDSEDVSPRALADPDSQFVECGAMTVHVKEAALPVSSACEDRACGMRLWLSAGTFRRIVPHYSDKLLIACFSECRLARDSQTWASCSSTVTAAASLHGATSCGRWRGQPAAVSWPLTAQPSVSLLHMPKPILCSEVSASSALFSMTPIRNCQCPPQCCQASLACLRPDVSAAPAHAWRQPLQPALGCAPGPGARRAAGPQARGVCGPRRRRPGGAAGDSPGSRCADRLASCLSIVEMIQSVSCPHSW